MRLFPLLGRRPDPSPTLRVAVAAGAPSSSGWITGAISLPVTAAWGDSTVPAGAYTLVVPSWPRLAMVYVQGAGHDAVIFAASVEGRSRPRAAGLTLARVGESYRVRSLELKNPGVVFHFDDPRAVPPGAAGSDPTES